MKLYYFTKNNLTKYNSVRETNSRKLVNNIHRDKFTIILPDYCRYNCQLQQVSSDYRYKIKNAMLNLLSITI